MSSGPTLEHDRWRGNNAPALRDSFRRVKYRSMDPVSRRPMARASICFSRDGLENSSDAMLLLPGIKRVASRQSFSGSPLARDSRGSMRGFTPTPSSPNSRQMKRTGSISGAGGPVTSSLRTSRSITFDTVKKSVAQESNALPLAPFDELCGSPLLMSLNLANEPRAAAAIKAPAAAPAEPIVRLCPTPLAATRTRAAATPPLRAASPEGSENHPLAPSAFSFPSLTSDPLLRSRAITPVVKGKTSIARLIAANQAFIGFDEEPLRDHFRATSALS